MGERITQRKKRSRKLWYLVAWGQGRSVLCGKGRRPPEQGNTAGQSSEEQIVLVYRRHHRLQWNRKGHEIVSVHRTWASEAFVYYSE